MEEITFTYGGFNSSDDLNLIVNDIKRGILGEISEVKQDIPGMTGELYQGMNKGSKKITIECTMKTNNEAERAELIHELANLFSTDSNDEYDLILSDEPQFAYHAHVTEVSDPERISNNASWSSFNITFTCSKPFAYGEQITMPVPAGSPTFTVNYEGTAKTSPVITIIPKEDINEIAIANSNGEYVYLGAGENTEGTTVNKNNEPRILKDECNTLDTWTKLTESNKKFEGENIYIDPAADFRSTTNSLRIGQKSGKDYFGPNNKGKWHGAGRFLTLPVECTDWRVRARLYNNENSYRARNKIEVYLLAKDGTRIGKLMLKDNDYSREVLIGCDIGSNSDNRKIIYGSRGTSHKAKTKVHPTKTVKVKVGTKVVMKIVKKKKKKVTENVYKTVNLDKDLTYSSYTDFYGWLELEKIGKKIVFRYLKLNRDGSNAWKSVHTATYTDKTGYLSKNLAGIACVIAKYDNPEDFVTSSDPKLDYTSNAMGLCDLSVYNILDGGNKTSKQKDVVAYAGEEIKIDSEDHCIYKNGYPFMSTYNIGSTFFNEIGGSEVAYSFFPTPDEAEISIDYVPTIH